ncbi:hypothetical protein HDU76_006532, partial [Blyttiomyces sp. JEL0837]
MGIHISDHTSSSGSGSTGSSIHKKNHKALGGLVGAGFAGFCELFVFHPVDTAA